MDEFDEFGCAKVFLYIFLGLLILWFVIGIPILIIDETVTRPQAAENANQFCKEQGYDFYESFERIGILSTTPVAIECKYVQNYQEMDIALRQTWGGEED